MLVNLIYGNREHCRRITGDSGSCKEMCRDSKYDYMYVPSVRDDTFTQIVTFIGPCPEVGGWVKEKRKIDHVVDLEKVLTERSRRSL